MVTAAPASGTGSGLHRFHQRVVTVTYRAGNEEKTLEGTAIACSAAGIIVKSRGITTMIPAASIVGEPSIVVARKKRVQKRVIRAYGLDDFVKQHLADRHGIPVSLLDAVEDIDAQRMHERIDHTDLGHSHGEKTISRTVVDPSEAADLMDKLGTPVIDFVNDEDDEEDDDLE